MSVMTYNSMSCRGISHSCCLAAASANRRRGADAHASSARQPQKAGAAGRSPRVTGREHPFTAPPRAQRGISEVCTLYTGGGRRQRAAEAPRRRAALQFRPPRRRRRARRHGRRTRGGSPDSGARGAVWIELRLPGRWRPVAGRRAVLWHEWVGETRDKLGILVLVARSPLEPPSYLGLRCSEIHFPHEA